jgi:two-component system chemotaxis response regulator CheB
VIGVILTGALYDGSAGLMAVRASGGLAVIQDPDEAAAAQMPKNAARIAGADFTVPLAKVGPLLTELVFSQIKLTSGGKTVDSIETMPQVVDHDMEKQVQGDRPGEVSVFTCPECGGALWQVDESRPIRFRCHVGHAYDAELLLAQKSEALEAAMWTAVRTFREKSVLARQLANRARLAGQAASADRFEEQAQQADEYGASIRGLLLYQPSQIARPESSGEKYSMEINFGGGHERPATN